MQATSSGIRASGNRLLGWGFLFLAMIGLSGCQEPADSWDRIAESGVLRVGVDPTFPPFALAEGEIVTGIDIDLARALAERMGLQAEFTYFGYDGLYDALTTGQVDALISALVVAPERTRDVAYSIPYFDAGLILVYSPQEGNIGGIEDMNGRILAVELGALAHVEALNRQSSLPAMEIRTYGSADEALAAVVSGEADASLVDSVSGRLYLRQHPDGEHNLTYLPQPIVSEPYAVAVRIADRRLVEEVNRTLAELDNEQTLERIIAAYLDP